MAGSNFSASKLLGLLKSFLSSMSSPLSGFDIGDVKVKEDNGIFSSLFSFNANSELGIMDKNGEEITDVSGQKISLSVLLSATNVREALAPLFSGINKLWAGDLSDEDKEDLLNVLLGSDRPDDDYHEQNGSGLLGVVIPKKLDTTGSTGGSYAGEYWYWATIAQNMLKYSLECESPGSQYGSIENVKLDRCSELISEYLVKVGKITNADEVQVDQLTLVLPILIRIQTYLAEYYVAAQKKAGQQNSNTTESEDNQSGGPTLDDLVQNESGTSADQSSGTNPTQASKSISVTLQKIAGTSEIKMSAITANYSPSLVLDDIEEILDQEEFINTIPEDPTSYAIGVDDDGFDIEKCEECEECDPCASLCEVFKSGIRAYRNLYILHWMSSGNDMMKLHNLSEEMYDELKDEIDTVGELLVEKQGTVPQLDFPCDYIPVQKYDFQVGLDQIKSLIQMYIDCIDYAYCNQVSDVQSTLDEWLRYWNKQLNYFVKGQEI